MSDPLDPLKNIGKQLEAAAKALGLEMQTFAVIPDFTGTSDMVQAVFVLTDVPGATIDVPVTDGAQDDFDAQFADIEANLKRDEEAEKLAETAQKAQQLRDRLSGGGGFLD